MTTDLLLDREDIRALACRYAHFAGNHLADVRGEDATAETYAHCLHRATRARPCVR